MPEFPPRLHVILAHNSDAAVVIRRGPSRCVCTIGWDRRTDHFKIAQWFRGRIYERRCDLSPDGKHLIYFAFKGTRSGSARSSWTAISRAPYLKAIAFWPKGDCWAGGGLFLDNRTFWRNRTAWEEEKPELAPAALREAPDFPFHESYGGECPGVYYIRLQKNGWQLTGRSSQSKDHDMTVFVKPLPKGWLLEKTAHKMIDSPAGKGCYHDTHRLLHPDSGAILDYPRWEWADLDGKRLVWAEDAILHAARLTSKGPGFTRILHDFNGMEFEALNAPY